MRILWLYKYMTNCDYDHHLHMSYAKFLASYPGITLKAYGPDLHLGYPLVTLKKYNKDITLNDIYNEYKFDVVIVNTKSRCFDFYSPRLNRAEGCWLPIDFSSWNKTPKIDIEEDGHYETDFTWFKTMNFDLILNRHYSQSLRDMIVPNKFFPFSVDLAYFNPWKTETTHNGKVISVPFTREKKIVMVGNSADGAYICRRLAIEKLAQHHIGINYTGSNKRDGEYLNLLRQYVGYVSCGSTYEICAAKNLEIMASGGVLLTNKFLGIDLLFPEDSYCEYKPDHSDILKQANKVLNDTDYVIKTVRSARETIYYKHSHDVRTRELLTILEGLK